MAFFSIPGMFRCDFRNVEMRINIICGQTDQLYHTKEVDPKLMGS